MTVVMDRALSPEQQAVLDSARPEELAQVKQWLTDRNQAPTPAAVAGRLLTVREHVEANRRKATKRQALDELLAGGDPTGPRAARLVKACVDEFGWGPTWAELGRAMRWSYRQRQETIHSLARVGWLSFTREPRSLRPGPRVTDPSWRPKPHKTATKQRRAR